jgi:hypothetical protein
MFALYGRWSNIPRENRHCELCQKNQIGDEYHYIFECTNLSEKRTSLLPKHLNSTYTEKLQINEQIKLYTIYTNTVNRQMELAYKI